MKKKYSVAFILLFPILLFPIVSISAYMGCFPYRPNPARELIKKGEGEIYFNVSPNIIFSRVGPYGLGGAPPVSIGIRAGLSYRVNFGVDFDPLLLLSLIFANLSGQGALSFDSYLSFNAVDTGMEKINFALSILACFEDYESINFPYGGGRIRNSILGLGFAGGIVLKNFHLSLEPVFFPIASGTWERNSYQNLKFGKIETSPTHKRNFDINLFTGYEFPVGKFNLGFSVILPGLLNFYEIWKSDIRPDEIDSKPSGLAASPFIYLSHSWTPILFALYIGKKFP